MFTYILIVLAMLISGIAGYIIGWRIRSLSILSEIEELKKQCYEIIDNKSYMK